MNTVSARNNILRRLAHALHRTPGEPEVEARFKRLLEQTPKAQELTNIADPYAHFLVQAANSGAEIIELNQLSDIVDWLATHSDDRPLAVSGDPGLQSLYWPMTIGADYRANNDVWGVALASHGIAETGTLAIDSSHTASALLFLCEVLVLGLQRSQIVERYEHFWHQFQSDENPAPRAVHWITGPSRTADVEQVIQLGAHGPRRLVIALYD